MLFVFSLSVSSIFNTLNIKPKVDPVEIMQYAASVYSGIEMNCIINACYNQGAMKIKYEPRKLFDVHAKAMIMLMGGEI